VLVKLVRADSLDEVFYCAFDLLVLALELLGLFTDPSLLHLHEVVESEGLSVLGQVDKDGLGEGL